MERITKDLSDGDFHDKGASKYSLLADERWALNNMGGEGWGLSRRWNGFIIRVILKAFADM